MQDLICTVPWSCDGDCERGWHQTHYWIHGDGSYTCSDECGDHETIEQSDVPSFEEQEQAWNEYFDFVAETGSDPLDEIMLPTLTPKKRQWQVRLRLWIGARTHGLRATGVRRRGRGPWVNIDDAPKEVIEYLFCGSSPVEMKHSIGPEFPTIDSLSAAEHETITKHGKLEARLMFTVDEPAKQWPDDRVKSYLKQFARKHLKTR